MTRHRLTRFIAIAALLVTGALADSVPLGGTPLCQPVVIGIDTSMANNSAGAVLGEAIGQTFWARDTLVRSLTVWRVAVQDTKYIGFHLFITRTDSAGNALPTEVVYDGPTVFNYFGDGVNPIPMRFDLNPPAVLPGTGLYAFFLLQSPCTLGYIDVLAYEGPEDPYPSGYAWWTLRSIEGGCHLRAFPNSNPRAELIFQMEFCDTTVPTLRSSWGSVKVLYR